MPNAGFGAQEREAAIISDLRLHGASGLIGQAFVRRLHIGLRGVNENPI